MKLRRTLFIFGALLFLYFFLYKIYIPRVSAFGCFDDCFNIVAGFFIGEGKILYSDIFFNHQMLPAYISSFIQQVTNPLNIFELILKHRQFVLLFSFVFNFLLVLRFGLPALLFTLIYEFSKFYLFGDRFLAEGLIVYPLVYVSNLVFLKFMNKRLYTFDYFLTALFSWFVIFMREPFIPLVILLMILVFQGKVDRNIKFKSKILFFILTFIMFFKTPLKDYYYNLVTINSLIFKNDLNLLSLLQSFFYPVYVMLNDTKNIFRILLFSVNLLLIFHLFNLMRLRKFKLVLFIFLILGLANLRSTEPGKVFYEAFHLLPWYGLVVSFASLFIFNFLRRYLAFSILFLAGALMIYLPQSFIFEKINQHEEFITNYGTILQTGNVINILKDKNDTYFADGFDELTHWQIDLKSPYEYSWYTSVMPRFSKYSQARLEMFKNNPPVFYYGSCPKEKNPQRLIPQEFRNKYKNLFSYNKPSCIYIREDKIKDISSEKIKKLNEYNFTL